MTTTAVRINPAEETIPVGPLTIRFLLTGENSSGTVAAFELTVPASEGLPAPPHSHAAYEETIYGVDGTIVWTVEGQSIEVGPGEALCIPRGAVHQFRNAGTGDAKALCVITPAVIGPQYFREVSGVLSAGGPPDRAKLVEIMRRHGLEPAR